MRLHHYITRCSHIVPGAEGGREPTVRSEIKNIIPNGPLASSYPRRLEPWPQATKNGVFERRPSWSSGAQPVVDDRCRATHLAPGALLHRMRGQGAIG